MDRKTNGFYEFGSYRLYPSEGLLLREDEPVHVPPKAFDTLRILLRNSGHTVSKEALMKAVWPDSIVEEGNLTHNISLLRKLLGQSPDSATYIETIPKRGYRFVAPARLVRDEPARPSRSTSRRWPRMAGTALGALLIAVAAFYWLAAGRPAMTFLERDWILILDFENHTEDPLLDEALFTAFTVSIEQSRHANVYTRARLERVLERMERTGDVEIDTAVGAEIAEREGLRALVACSVAHVGGEYVLTARLLDPRERKSALSLIERASGQDRILEALENLARGLRRGLGESLYSISLANRALAEVTTPSLDALKAYQEGRRLWRQGDYHEAVDSYQRALQHDPEFAMAHAALGSAYYSHIFVQPGKGEQHYSVALQNLNRLTEREQGLLQAAYRSAARHSEEAIRLYTGFLQQYPDDLDAQYALANLLRDARRWEEAAAGYQQILRIDPQYAQAHINLATTLQKQHKFTEAILHFDRAFEIHPDWLRIHNLNHEYGFALVGAGQEDQAREVFRKARETPELRIRALRSLALLDLYQGKYHAALEKLREGASQEPDPLSKARSHIYLSILREGQGDRAGQLQELDRARAHLSQTRPVLWMIFRVAVYYARAGELAAAGALLDEYRDEVDLQNYVQAADLLHLEGVLELSQGNVSRALERLESVRERASPVRPLISESLAFAYRMAGETEKEIAVYQELILASYLGWEAQQACLTARYYLARAYLSMGEKEEARKTLDELLSIWEDGDPDLPLLVAARELAPLLR